MTYNKGIPLGNNSPANQVVGIQTNFSQFASIFSSSLAGANYNHRAINSDNQGKHESVIFQNQAGTPFFNGRYISIFSKNATSKASTEPQLFYKLPVFLPTPQDPNKPGNGAILWTYNKVNTAGPIYQSFLMGGYLLYFGQVSALGDIILSPSPTKIVMAMAYPNTFSGPQPFSVNVNIKNTNTITIFSNASGAFTFTWMAIANA